MRIGGRVHVVDWGHLAVATFVAAVSLAYLLDARATSLNIQNLLLVQPTAILVLVLYLFVLPQCVRPRPAEPPEAEPAPGETPAGLLRIAALAGAFGVFVFTVEEVGYDLGGWAFALAGLWICGERRPLVLLLLPLAFAAAVILGFKAMVPYPMTTRFL